MGVALRGRQDAGGFTIGLRQVAISGAADQAVTGGVALHLDQEGRKIDGRGGRVITQRTELAAVAEPEITGGGVSCGDVRLSRRTGYVSIFVLMWECGN